MLRARVIALCLAMVTVALGLGVRAVLSGGTAKYGGVALWATLVYALILVAAPRIRVSRAAGLALGISFAVELAQLTPGPAWLSSKHVLLRLIFGTTFSAWDLPAYAVGVALGAVVQMTMKREYQESARTPPAKAG